MKKKIFVCLAAFALVLSLCACGVGGSQNAGFSTNRWGDDMDTVLAALDGEKFMPIEDVIIVMDVDVNGLNANAIYAVDTKAGLQGIAYMFDETEDSIADYNALKKAITQAHGKPGEDIVEERNPAVSTVTEEYALQNGYVVYKTNWTTKAETIQMSMGRDNDGKIMIVCQFTASDSAQG